MNAVLQHCSISTCYSGQSLEATSACHHTFGERALSGRHGSPDDDEEEEEDDDDDGAERVKPSCCCLYSQGGGHYG